MKSLRYTHCAVPSALRASCTISALIHLNLETAVARNDGLVRVLKLARVLADSRRGLPLRKLAERHGWQLRTLYRDIEALEASGFPVIKEEDRFRLPPDALNAPPEKLQPNERLALFSARQLLSGMRWTATGRALESLWQRLTGDQRSAGLLVPGDPAPGFSMRSTLAIDYAPHQRTIETLEAAIAERRVVSCGYDALSTGASTTRDLEPLLVHWDPTLEALYLVAWCRLRDALRVFAVHRIRLIAMTRQSFDPRPALMAQTALKDAFRVWRGDHVETVQVRLSGWAGREASERRLHRVSISSDSAPTRCASDYA